MFTRAQITYLNFGQVAGAFGGCCGTGSALSIFGVVQFGNTLSIKDSVAEKLQFSMNFGQRISLIKNHP